MTKITVAFGAMAPPLHQQLPCTATRLRHAQKCADAIVLLAIGGVLTDAEVHRARKRLLRRLRNLVTDARKKPQ